MREAVQRIYRERKSLIAGLKVGLCLTLCQPKLLRAVLQDVDSIVAKLDGVLLSITVIVIIFVSLLIFNRKNTLASLVPLATIILGFSFIFGHSAQTLFESVSHFEGFEHPGLVPYCFTQLIFIFSTHVFDVGDLVMIDDQVCIRFMCITTKCLGYSFIRSCSSKNSVCSQLRFAGLMVKKSLLQMPYSQAQSLFITYGAANQCEFSYTLASNSIANAKHRWESTTLTVAYDTSMEAIEHLKSKISAYVNTNSREWSGFSLNIDKMEFQNAIYLIVAMERKYRFC